MLVQRTQPQAGKFMPYLNKTTAKTAQKLKQINFDIRPNRLVSEPYKDLYTRYCGESGNNYSEGACDAAWIHEIVSC